MDSLLRDALARSFDDFSGARIERADANKTILYVPEAPGAPYPLFVKLYHYRGWRLQLQAVWRRINARHDMRVAQRLKKAGLGVPEPVAALVKRNWFGWANRSLYAAQWLPQSVPLARLVRDTKTHGAINPGSCRHLIAAIGRFVRDLHRNGVRTKDLNSGNLLVQQPAPGRFELFLVDYEHVRLVRKVPWEICVRNLMQIGVDLTSLVEDGERVLCEAYAQSGEARELDALVREVSERIRQRRLLLRQATDRRFAPIFEAARTPQGGARRI